MKKINTYTLPRPFSGYNIPISIQSAYLKDYCNRNKLNFSLPETELTTTGSYHVLKKLLNQGNDIAMCSIFILPLENRKKLSLILSPYIKKKIILHFALESKSLQVLDVVKWRDSHYSIQELIPSYSQFMKKIKNKKI